MFHSLSEDPSNIVVYTDASLARYNGFTRVGAAAVVYWKGQEIRHITMGLGGRAEVYDGELAALMMGMTIAVDESKKRQHTIKHIHIFADNTSAIAAIYDTTPTSGQKYKHTFYTQTNAFLDSDANHKVSLAWCPGHSGVEGNTRADELAKQATLLGWTAPISTSRTNALRRATLTTLREWTKDWRRINKQGWFAVADRLQPSLKPTKHAKHLSRRREIFGRLVQARTGHAYTGEFRQRFFPSEPIRCPCDNNTIETREHILLSCPRYETHRHILRRVSQSIVLSEILGTPEGIEALAQFLEASGAFTRDGKPRTSPLPAPPPTHVPSDDDNDDDSLSSGTTPDSHLPSDFG